MIVDITKFLFCVKTLKLSQIYFWKFEKKRNTPNIITQKNTDKNHSQNGIYKINEIY